MKNFDEILAEVARQNELHRRMYFTKCSWRLMMLMIITGRNHSPCGT